MINRGVRKMARTPLTVEKMYKIGCINVDLRQAQLKACNIRGIDTQLYGLVIVIPIGSRGEFFFFLSYVFYY